MSEKRTAEADLEETRGKRTRASRRARPPEVAAADIDRIFDRLRTIAPPARIDAAWARSANLIDASIVLPWIGLAPNGIVDRPLWNRVRLPSSRQDALSGLVRQAYAPIFDAVDVATASRDRLEEAFVNHYDLGDTKRYIRAFATLCKHAGIPVAAIEARAEASSAVATATKAMAGKTAPEARAAARQAPNKIENTAEHPTLEQSISLSIHIPAGWTDEQIRERVAAVKRALAGEP